MAEADATQSSPSDYRVVSEDECENDIEHQLPSENSTCLEDAGDEIDADEDSCCSIDSNDLGRNRPSSFRFRDSASSLHSSTSLGGGISSMLEADKVNGTIEGFVRKREKELMIEQEDSSLDTNEDRSMWGMEAMLVNALEKRNERKKRIVQIETNELQRRKSIAHRKRKRAVHSAIFSATEGIVPEDGIPNEIKMLTGEVGVVPAYKFASSNPVYNTEGSDAPIRNKKRNGKCDETKTPRLRNGYAGTNEKFTPSLLRRKLRLPKVMHDDDLKIGDWWKLAEGNDGGEVQNENILSVEPVNTVEKSQDQYFLSVAPVSDLLPHTVAPVQMVEQSQDEYSLSVAPVSDLLPQTRKEKKFEDTNNSGHSGDMTLNEMIAAAAAERQDRIAQTGIDATSIDTKSVDVTSLVTLSPTIDVGEDSNGKKNSGYGGTMGLNDMIAAAAAERQVRLEKSKHSASATKQHDYLLQAERDATSVTASMSIHSFSSTFLNDREEEENILARKEMAIAEMSAETELMRERTKDRLMKAREEKAKQEEEKNTKATHRVWENAEYDPQQRKQDKENHRNIFLPVVGEAATYGRLVRLEEKIVEGIGGQQFHGINTWSGPKLRTDDRRSDALKAIQEAAAIGRMKQPKEKQKSSHTRDADFIQNYVNKISENEFDIDNQVDENGEKIERTTLLLDRYVKKIAEGKKERMWADSEAIENREHKTATYESFDDVELPTDVLPTYQQLMGRPSKLKKISSESDLALIAMQMSEKKIHFDPDEDNDDQERIKKKRLRVLESISRDVATSAWERAYRLQKPKAQLRVTRKCFCPYCKDPNPFQTHKYKLLMYPERFDDISDNGSRCQVLADTPDAASNIAKVAQNSQAKYTITPGGRKKKIIRVVRRRKKKSEGDRLPTVVSLGDNKRVIDGSSLTPDKLDKLTEQLLEQGSNNLTTDELVQIADALKSCSSSNADVPAFTKAEESSNLDHNPDLNDTTLTSQNMFEKISADTIIDQALQVADDLSMNKSLPMLPFAESDDDGDFHKDSDFNLSLNLSSLDVKLDDSSTPKIRSQNSAESTSKRKTKKSSKNRNRDHTKSPSSRKSRRKVNAEVILEGVDQSSVNNISATGRKKTKNGRRRPKGLVQSETELSPKVSKSLSPKVSKSPSSRKKSLRSKLKKSVSLRARNELLSTSDQNSRGKEDETSKPARRGGRRSLSPRGGYESLYISDNRQQENDNTTPKPPRRIKCLGNPKLNRRISSISESGNVQKSPKSTVEKANNRSRFSKELTEADLPRTRRKKLQKAMSMSRLEEETPVTMGRVEEEKLDKPATIFEDENIKWQPARRAPTRTNSLPISPSTKKMKSLTRSSSEEDQPSHKPPSRSVSLHDRLQCSNSFVANLFLKRKLSKSQSDRSLKSRPGSDRSIKSRPDSDRSIKSRPISASKADRPKALSSADRELLYELIASKNYPSPPSTEFTVDSVAIDEDPLLFKRSATIPEEGSDSTAKTTDVSSSVHSTVNQQQEHYRMVNNSRKSNSLDRLGIQKFRDRGQTKIPRKGKKPNVVEVKKMDESSKSFDGTFSTPLRDPIRQPKRRSQSMDRVGIMEQKGRGLSSRQLKIKDTTEKGKKKKTFKLKNWLKKGDKTKPQIEYDLKTQ